MRSFIATTTLATAIMAVKLSSDSAVDIQDMEFDCKKEPWKCKPTTAVNEEKKQVNGPPAATQQHYNRTCFSKFDSNQAKQVFEKITKGKHVMTRDEVLVAHSKIMDEFVARRINSKFADILARNVVEKCFNTTMAGIDKTTNVCMYSHATWNRPLEAAAEDANRMQNCKSEESNNSMFALVMDAISKGENGPPAGRGEAGGRGPAAGPPNAKKENFKKQCFLQVTEGDAKEIFSKLAHGKKNAVGKEEISIKQFYLDFTKIEKTLRGEFINPSLFEPQARGIMKDCFGARNMNDIEQFIKHDSAQCSFSMAGFVSPLERGVKVANQKQQCGTAEGNLRDFKDIIFKALQ